MENDKDGKSLRISSNAGSVGECEQGQKKGKKNRNKSGETPPDAGLTKDDRKTMNRAMTKIVRSRNRNHGTRHG